MSVQKLYTNRMDWMRAGLEGLRPWGGQGIFRPKIFQIRGNQIKCRSKALLKREVAISVMFLLNRLQIFLKMEEKCDFIQWNFQPWEFLKCSLKTFKLGLK